MSDFEMLYIVLMINLIIVTILIAHIENTKSNCPKPKVIGYFFVNQAIWSNCLLATSLFTYL